MTDSPQNRSPIGGGFIRSRRIGRSLPGGRMHYVDEGPARADGDAVAPTLLFVHGNPTWSFHWRRLIEALRTAIAAWRRITWVAG